MPKLLDRLETKLKSQWNKDPYWLAVSILIKNWYIDANWALTDKGKAKEALPEWTKWLWNKKTLTQSIRDTLAKTYR